MEFFFGLFIVVVAIFIGLWIWIELSNRKEAMKSGVCRYCNQAQATKKLPKEGYACKECYKKIAPAQYAQIQSENQAAQALLAAEKPVEVKAIHGTCSRDRYGKFWPGVSDYAGGWDVQVNIKNRSNNTIKYVIAELIPINAVGDVGYSPTVGAGAKLIRITGPVPPHGTLKGMEAKKFWYDIQIVRVDVGTVKVVFMDGTEKEFRQ